MFICSFFSSLTPWHKNGDVLKIVLHSVIIIKIYMDIKWTKTLIIRRKSENNLISRCPWLIPGNKYNYLSIRITQSQLINLLSKYCYNLSIKMYIYYWVGLSSGEYCDVNSLSFLSLPQFNIIILIGVKQYCPLIKIKSIFKLI